jgi:hypothetical protein
MEYRCAPIYKFLVMMVIYFLFLSHYKNITSDKYLPIVLIFIGVQYIVDHMLILNYPAITSDKKEQVYDEIMEDSIEEMKDVKNKLEGEDDEDFLDEDELDLDDDNCKSESQKKKYKDTKSTKSIKSSKLLKDVVKKYYGNNEEEEVIGYKHSGCNSCH